MPTHEIGPPSDRIGVAALVGAVAASIWAPLSLWPGLSLPAWPAVSLGLVATVLALGRGRPIVRASAAIGGLTAAFVGGAQIAVLWAIAVLAP